jgi:hypothetical protein
MVVGAMRRNWLSRAAGRKLAGNADFPFWRASAHERPGPSSHQFCSN